MSWAELSFPEVALNEMIDAIIAEFRAMKDLNDLAIFKSVERTEYARFDIDHENNTPMVRIYTEESEIDSRTVGHQMTYEYEYVKVNIEMIYSCLDETVDIAKQRDRFTNYILSKMQAPDSENTEGIEPGDWWGLPAQRVGKKHQKLDKPGFYKTTLQVLADCHFNETV